mgnify:CR=1 FL=1
MSSLRNRAHARFFFRQIEQELQGAQDAFIAFEGYSPQSSTLHGSVLQRPADRRSEHWFDKVLAQFHELLAGFSRRG